VLRGGQCRRRGLVRGCLRGHRSSGERRGDDRLVVVGGVHARTRKRFFGVHARTRKRFFGVHARTRKRFFGVHARTRKRFFGVHARTRKRFFRTHRSTPPITGP